MRRFLTLCNFIFYSLALSVPSLILIFYQDLSLENLIIISLTIKLVTIMLMMFVLILKGLIKKNKKKFLLNNLKKNSKWLTSNSILDQFYYLLDKKR